MSLLFTVELSELWTEPETKHAFNKILLKERRKKEMKSSTNIANIIKL